MQPLSDLAERERRFFNESQGSYRRWRNAIWRVLAPFNRNDELHELYDASDKRVLLYGCGPGYDAARMVQAGAASITAIDISDGEIAEAVRRARTAGYADAVDFRAADAHDTGFPDDSFDLVVGNAILHHLDLARALGEIQRILAPGGRAVFLEPLAHNPLVSLGRRLTPAARSQDEHPLTVDDWRMCARVFPGFRHREMELTSVPLTALVWLLPRAWRQPLARRVSALDDRLLGRHPGLRRYARTTLLILE